ncbi:MAG: restriction endonuclease subunit S [Pseudomonas sp.]
MRETGEHWLGAIPMGWGAHRIKVLFEIRKRIAGELGHDVLSVTQRGLRVRDTESNDGQLAMDYSKYQVVEVGDFVMNHMDLLTGFVDVAARPGVTSPDYRVFAARRPAELHSQYFLYVFQNAYRQKIFYAFGQGASELGRWRMPTDNFNSFVLPVPSLTEQVAIAAFLDRETGKIDALVEEQRRLICLLKEKRQAVISHAVTKGLDPNAKMTPSGVDWLGDVPEHWVQCQLKRAVVLQRGHDLPLEERREGDVPVVSSGGYLGLHDVAVAKAPGIVTGRYGTIGEFTYVERDFWPLNTALYAVEMHGNIPKFLYYLLTSLSDLFIVHSKKSAVPGVDRNDVHPLGIVLPPPDEQADVARYLDERTSKFAEMIKHAADAVALLSERRAALISAAVTGKIDVRSRDRHEVAA